MIDIKPGENVVAVKLPPPNLIDMPLDPTMYRQGSVEWRYETCFDRTVDRVIVVDESTDRADGEVKVRGMRRLDEECGYTVYNPVRYRPRRGIAVRKVQRLASSQLDENVKNLLGMGL